MEKTQVIIHTLKPEELASLVAEQIKTVQKDSEPRTIWVEFDLLTRKEAAILLGISKPFFDKLFDRKIIPAGRVGFDRSGNSVIKYEKNTLLAIRPIVQSLKFEHNQSEYNKAFQKVEQILIDKGFKF